MSVLCEICKAISSEKESQMVAAGLNVMIPNDLTNLLGIAVSNIKDVTVRDWALNELKGVSRDSNDEPE